ncbi:Indole-3-pyruvate decarboxylase [Rosistilla oblonga]|uniref:alpha-keto acid decarboxylase family protein n=1 Tax=Rosistilla oblonga TaxID=2527990 RepID=UPI00118B5B43|nr:thiamine pyrophosphate-binding protein [Rosistilla oblonga]QDV12037.1 Indole-3-pyruvate decarboxylase [Rosistilla oblonga]
MSKAESNHNGAAESRRPMANLSIGEYLIRRLSDYGIEHLFGIPGDYVLSFYSMLEQSRLKVIGCTREDCAGYAADAYARLHGMGAVCVTYSVGGLSVCNSIAGAYAEKSPVVVISGAPGMNERKNNPLLHHKVRDFRTQLEVFQKVTIDALELTDPLTAFADIDRALDAADRFKRPVYIELPRDMVHAVPPITHSFRQPTWEPDVKAIDEAAAETAQRIAAAERPVIVAGVELHRFGLQNQLVELAERMQIPIATTILGKSVISEHHPLFVGLYEGAIGRNEVTEFVEQSDLILLLGTFMTDINLGIYTANLDLDKCVYATSEALQISHHHFHNVALGEFLDRLNSLDLKPTTRTIPDAITFHRDREPFEIEPTAPLRISRLMSRLNTCLDLDTVVIADVGDALFAATELVTHDRGEFLSPAYYTSMGFSVPAAVGAAAARPDHRVVVLVGDGAFQMTGCELSTLVRNGCSPIVIVLDNHGYGTERYLQAGDWEYNEIQPWAYHKMPELLGGGKGFLVDTEAEFDAALSAAWDDRSQPTIIQARLVENDASETLKRLGQRMGEKVAGR